MTLYSRTIWSDTQQKEVETNNVGFTRNTQEDIKKMYPQTLTKLSIIRENIDFYFFVFGVCEREQGWGELFI